MVRGSVRLALPAALIAVAAIAAGAYSLARIVEVSRPDLALSIMPSLSPAAGAKADELLANSANGTDRGNFAQARALALRSLRADALNPQALRTLAATEEGNPRHLAQLLEMASRVSRRDVGTQLLQIELDVARGDIASTLLHYDQALRVKPSVGPTLFPILLSATDDPAILRAVRKTVARDPQWLPDLITWSLDNPDTLKALSRLIGSIPPGSDALAPGYGQSLVDTLVKRGDYADAFEVYKAYSGGKVVPGFAAGFTFTPIDWTVADNYDTGGDLVMKPHPHVRFYAQPGAHGIFMFKLAALQPGRYRMSAGVGNAADAGQASLEFQVSCQTDQDRGLAEARFPVASGRKNVDFTIPAGSCPLQWIRFSVAAQSNPFEADLTGVDIHRID